MNEVESAQTAQIIQLLIPLVMPIVIGFARNKVKGLEGSNALWANLALNIAAQIVVGLGGEAPITDGMLFGGVGGLAGSGGASAVKSVRGKKKS